MPFKSIWSRICQDQNPRRLNKRPRRSGREPTLSFETLEPRNLLAGIFFSGGEVTIAGDGANDVGAFTQVDSTTYRASLSGVTSQTFTSSQVQKIVFIGFGGDDTFTNWTAVESLLLGNDGVDILTGGSGIDVVNGGSGNDVLNGGGGADRLIGNAGDDELNGGDGHDRLFGGSGVNEINGDDGDDLIFGGDEIDTISGGNGADQIFSLAGDDIISLGNGGTPGASDPKLADLVLSGSGNDTISGGTGLNVMYGGDGNDVFNGGNGENRMHGQNGDDQLNSGSANDYLAGQVGDDEINAGGGNDYILPGFGDDTIDAGSGNDFVAFNTQYSDYQITVDGVALTVHDTRNVDGTDTVVLAESFRFSDGDRAAAADIIQRVTINPIIVSNSNGSNTAEFLGDAAEEADIKFRIDEIFHVAGIDVAWEAPKFYSNSFANVGSGGTRPTDDLNTVTTQGDSTGPGSSNSWVIDMYFVEVAAGFGDTGEDTANGLAFIGVSGVMMHVGDDLVSFEGGREVVGRVVAHEIAHNLGLDHVSATSNLMASGSSLTSSQINTMLASNLSVPI